ncbi:hypothetical protein SPSPH_031900 [Sporomusa sphaeroides DSM 2875]|uniref:Uncharacterized protein n=1 Tax=Sporomusa sphaeroides DSM 2875 TaxID=1337886 RepID=A0ABM9W899_9FIRM|nr:hypothetical protein SPSPH_36590 [Sporomusa sphaeroides DSM 2875]CVK21216.1 hypothetical protein SSPH_03900 [Sporomusa sphaeroides DSM 2875]
MLKRAKHVYILLDRKNLLQLQEAIKEMYVKERRRGNGIAAFLGLSLYQLLLFVNNDYPKYFSVLAIDSLCQQHCQINDTGKNHQAPS